MGFDEKEKGSSEELLAERVGFEPTLELPLNTLSKRAPSATRPSLRLRMQYKGGNLRRCGSENNCTVFRAQRLEVRA